VRLGSLLQLLDPLIASNAAEKIIAAAFQNIVESTSAGDLREIYKSSNVNILDFFRPANRTVEHLAQWLEKHKLACLFPRQYITTLQQMIQRGDKVDSILAWIEDNFDSDVWTDGDVSFAVSLCHAILEHIASKTALAASGSFESDEQMVAEEKRLLALYCPLLAKFVSSYTDTQQQCLYEVQRFCHGINFPKGCMERIFHQFYMQEVILEEVYRAWAADETETPGKQQALAEVSDWLKWLDSAQKEEAEERGDEDGDGSDRNSNEQG